MSPESLAENSTNQGLFSSSAADMVSGMVESGSIPSEVTDLARSLSKLPPDVREAILRVVNQTSLPKAIEDLGRSDLDLPQ